MSLGHLNSSSSASHVQVDVTFHDPVVFAGQFLAAIITFRNTRHHHHGSSSDHKYHLNPDAILHNDNSSSSEASSRPSPKPLLKSSSLEANPFINDPSNSTNPNIMNGYGTEKSNSSSTTNSNIPSPTLSIDTSRSSKNVPTILTEPASPVAQNGNGKEITITNGTNKTDDTNDKSEPDDGMQAHKNLDSNLNSGWEIPGRRISAQIANTFRDFYLSNNSSNPDMHMRTSSVDNSKFTKLPTHQLTRSGSSIRYKRPVSEQQDSSQGLLMGYAQVQGYYILDDDLIDLDEFIHVKTQGVVVNQSGGIGYGPTQGGGLLKGIASGLGSLFQSKDGGLSPADGSSPETRLGRTLSIGRRSISPSPAQRRSGTSTGRSTPTPGAGAIQDNAIPIFSTPQSLLFVDLKLNPGESKTYYYKLQLPKTLPPSCRAKSIRIHYNLVIGTQKLDNRGIPQPKTTFVPFRVFPFVDRFGQQYAHDLKIPIVLQSDQASVLQLPSDRYRTKSSIITYVQNLESKSAASQKKAEEKKAKFLTYLDDVLNGIENKDKSRDPKTVSFSSTAESAQSFGHRRSSSTQLAIITPTTSQTQPYSEIPMMPTASNASLSSITSNSSIGTVYLDDMNAQENIDYFTRFQQVKPPAKALKTRFDIGRGGKRIATVTLSKAVYKVGENVIFKIDFGNAALKCFHITASLETEETIETPVLKQFKSSELFAKYSSSLHDGNGDQENIESNKKKPEIPHIDTTGLTRRIYSQATMSTYSMSKSAFEFTIPATATPQFSTSAISLKWVLKLDFITSPASSPPMNYHNKHGTRGSISRSRRLSRSSIDEVLTAMVPERTAQEIQQAKKEQLEREYQKQNGDESHPQEKERNFFSDENEDDDKDHDIEQTDEENTDDEVEDQDTNISGSKPSASKLSPEDIPDDPHSALEVVHVSSKGMISIAKETIACESFNCKIPLSVIPTNQDITALLQHSISSTRSWQI